MSPKSASNLLIIFASLTGIASLATPASAQLRQTRGLLTNTTSPTLTSTTSTTGSLLNSTTSTTGSLLNSTTSSTSPTLTSTTSTTGSLLNSTTSTTGSLLNSTTSTTSPTLTSITSTTSPTLTSTTSSTSPTLTSTTSTTGSLLNSTTSSTGSAGVLSPIVLPVLNNTTPIIQNTIDTTAGVSVINNITATLQETTNTTVGSIAGVSTDSQTIATVINPTQLLNPGELQLPSLSNPTDLIKQAGDATLGLKINQNGITLDAGANLNLGVGNIAQVGICLDGNVSLGSTGRNALADCKKPDEPKRVPEPATIGGLGLISAYMMFWKRRLSKSRKVSAS